MRGSSDSRTRLITAAGVSLCQIHAHFKHAAPRCWFSSLSDGAADRMSLNLSVAASSHTLLHKLGFAGSGRKATLQETENRVYRKPHEALSPNLTAKDWSCSTTQRKHTSLMALTEPKLLLCSGPVRIKNISVSSSHKASTSVAPLTVKRQGYTQS